MKAQELMKLRNSDEAPFDHQQYTLWLHDKIIDKIMFELWEFREQKSDKIKSTYAACNDIMSLPSLKRV